MNKIWIVLKNEFINTITRRSFLLTLILVPLVPALILGGIRLLGGDDTGEDISNIFQPGQDTEISEGYVDQANIINEIPEWLGENRLVAYQDVESAYEAAVSGEISGYYVIQPNYLEDGAVRYIREDFNPTAALENTNIINQLIEYNLLGSDQNRFEAYQNPVQIEQVDLDPGEVQRDTTHPLAFYLPYGVTMLFYVVIFTSASLMLNSVAKEKENRVMEILMSSIKPNELLTGKILGLGLIGLLQMVVWLGSAYALLQLGGSTLNIPASLQLPPELFLWGVPLFILGYLLYASIMAGVGALVPNLKEASQATFYVILPMLVPLVLVGVIIEQPNATLPVILSLFPLTAPNTIITRMAVTTVPLWQLLVAVALMIGTIILLIKAVSRMFRAQLLLTGKKFEIGLYFKALMGQEITTNEIS